ncbi:unnamed protein product [Cuscuta europaea]|uniref:Uncharacterized protein n=1 Tax=Cuscuta europaea TaxID=41803 RepID=A0A9P1ECQ3_CUSEU|nr:unnamed protein product [Cuscuta europaea]
MLEPFSWTPTTTHMIPQPPAAASSTPTAPSAIPYSGPTFSGQPGLSPFDAPSQHLQPGSTTVTLSTLSNQLSFSTPNVTNIVTTRLDAVEDYLPWHTQFESFLVSHGLLGIIDGSIPAPPKFKFDNFNREASNPKYHSWLKIDQTVRSWLFATLSRNILLEVHTIRFSALIWERLEIRFMAACVARSMELKRLLSALKKKEDQSMDGYLREIIVLTDVLNAINSPVSNRELLQTTIEGLGPEYESVITSVTLFPDSFTLDTLRPQLMALEQHALFLRSHNSHPGHQAFATDFTAAAHPPDHGNAPSRGTGRGYRGGRARGHRGRGRGYGGQPGHSYAPQPAFQFARQQQGPSNGQFLWQQGPPPVRGVAQAGYQGFPSVEQNYQSPPPLVVCCQLCFSPGHSAMSCSHFTGSSTPALAVIPTGETNAAVWYPDSSASAHMTPNEGQSHGSHTPSGNQ